MTIQIALAGKGSAGKSTLIPHLLTHLQCARPDARILVVDADPHQSATTLLGVTPEITLGQLRSRYERRLLTGVGLRDETREAFAERAMGLEAMNYQQGYDLLTMGHWEPPGSQCTVNRVLERALGALSGHYDVVLYDNEAGIEHMGRFATIPLDLLLLVATPDPLFLDVATRVLERSSEVQRRIDRRWLVLNRIEPDEFDDSLTSAARLGISGVEIAATLPESPGLRRLSRQRRSPLLLNPADPWALAVAALAARIARSLFGTSEPFARTV